MHLNAYKKSIKQAQLWCFMFKNHGQYFFHPWFILLKKFVGSQADDQIYILTCNTV